VSDSLHTRAPVGQHISETTRQILTNICCTLPVALARSSSGGVATRFVYTFADDVIFAHNGPYRENAIALQSLASQRRIAQAVASLISVASCLVSQTTLGAKTIDQTVVKGVPGAKPAVQQLPRKTATSNHVRAVSCTVGLSGLKRRALRSAGGPRPTRLKPVHAATSVAA